MSQETEKLLHDYRSKAQVYAKAKAKAEFLESKRKVLLAIESKEAASKGHKTVASQEREALTSDGYMDLLKEIYSATIDEQIARSDMRAAEHNIECWRTEQANNRMERKTYAA